jgi:AAA domain
MTQRCPSECAVEATDFFARNRDPSPEIVEGVMREGQIVAVGGAFGVGKSPWLQELLICRIYGLPWCGRAVLPGQAVLFDFENPAWVIRQNLENICVRHGVSFPRIPEDLEIFAELDDQSINPATSRLFHLLKNGSAAEKFALLEEVLSRKPNALVIIDPPEMFFPIDTRQKKDVLWLYTQYRLVLSKRPGATILNTFNLRKQDKRAGKADLLLDPRGWLEEIAGSLDLLNRSDVRLGMDFYNLDEIRVVNGVRRGEELHPLLIKTKCLNEDPEKPAGFEVVSASELELFSALAGKLHQYWSALPNEFTFELATEAMGKSNFDRLKKRTVSLGVLEQVGRGRYRKINL